MRWGLSGLRKFGVYVLIAFVIFMIVYFVLLPLIDFVIGLVKKKKTKKETEKFDDELLGEVRSTGVSADEVDRAVGDVKVRLDEAVKRLKTSGLTLYTLPWYLIIGEPQSGKTTTIKNSGMEFPVGTERLSGSGGTRNCDWWFTNEAVILDTAGRWTDHEQNAPDREEWKAFLQLLKRNRYDCPINGVIVVIPCTSLLEDSAALREEKATKIKDKLNNIQQTLGVRFPVFLLITKSDRILGFTEFFYQLDPIEQRQLLGWSNQQPFDRPVDSSTLSAAFDRLTEVIVNRRLKLLAEEASQGEIDKLYVFPDEFGSLKEHLLHYYDTIFTQSVFTEPLFFRGFYFSSGLQQGQPIARACSALLSGRNEAGEDVIEHLEQTFAESRSFFIYDFYQKKVFPEKELILRSEAALAEDKKKRRLSQISIAGLIVLAAAMIGWGVWDLNVGIASITDDIDQAYEWLIEGIEDPTEKKAFHLVTSLDEGEKNLSIHAKAVLSDHISTIKKAISKEYFFESILNESTKCLGNPLYRPGQLGGLFKPAFKSYIEWAVASMCTEEPTFSKSLELASLIDIIVEAADPGWPEDLQKWLAHNGRKGQRVGERFPRLFAPEDRWRMAQDLRGSSAVNISGSMVRNLAVSWDLKVEMPWWSRTAEGTNNVMNTYGNLLDLRRSPDDTAETELKKIRYGIEQFFTTLQELNNHLRSTDSPDQSTEVMLERVIENCAASYKTLIDEISQGEVEDEFREDVRALEDELSAQSQDLQEKLRSDFRDSIQTPLTTNAHIINAAGLGSIKEGAKGTLGSFTKKIGMGKGQKTLSLAQISPETENVKKTLQWL
ncbi:type VI secretion protein IcmF/TssM N-terminal domain-containing protein, partial [Thermodesulfobacteriota bacterium]